MRKQREYAFEEGTLLIREGGKTNHIRLWPHPYAWYQRCDRSLKTEFTPTYRLIGCPPARRNRQSAENEPHRLHFDHGATHKNKAFRLLRHTLPGELADKIGPFSGFQWRPVVALYYHPAARDLLNSNPALAFCLANNQRFIRMEAREPDTADRLLALRQKDILQWLEFPGTKSMIKIMRKLAPASVVPRYVSTLRWIMRREEHARLLPHLSRLNAGVLEFFITPELRQRITPRLLEEIGADADEDEEGCTANALRDALRTHRDVHGNMPPPQTGDRQAVYTFLERVQQEKYERRAREHEDYLLGNDQDFGPDNYERRTCEYPPAQPATPPVPGNGYIVPLLTPEMLKVEGQRQHNCAAGCWYGVRRGLSAVYRVLAPERATLELVPSAVHGEWKIAQLKAACNQPVRKETREAVKAWLAEYQTGL